MRFNTKISFDQLNESLAITNAHKAGLPDSEKTSSLPQISFKQTLVLPDIVNFVSQKLADNIVQKNPELKNKTSNELFTKTLKELSKKGFENLLQKTDYKIFFNTDSNDISKVVSYIMINFIDELKKIETVAINTQFPITNQTVSTSHPARMHTAPLLNGSSRFFIPRPPDQQKKTEKKSGVTPHKNPLDIYKENEKIDGKEKSQNSWLG